MNRVVFLTIVAMLSLANRKSVFAERLPQPGVAQMCEMAELVVEGDHHTAVRVTVTRVWKAPPGWSRETKEVQVHALTELERVPTYLYTSVPNPKVLKTTTATLFLTRDKKTEAWVPLYTYKDAYSHKVSSCGVIWWDEKDCFLYTQNFSGVYSLTHWHFLTRGKPAPGPVTPQTLRKYVEAAFADNQRFQDDLAIADRRKPRLRSARRHKDSGFEELRRCGVANRETEGFGGAGSAG